MEAETSAMDEGEQAAAHARDDPGALKEPHPAPEPPPPPPEDPKDPLPAAQKPELPVPAGKPAEEPCDEDMQNSQDDARFDALLQPRDGISTATERTANGGDFRLQLPPMHPLAEVQFASEGLQQPNSGVQSRSRRYQFGIALTLESNSTLHSPHDSVAALAGATAYDPNMLLANSKNDPASLISPRVLKTFTDLQLKTFFDEQRIPWGRTQDRVQKQLSCFNVYSDVIRDATEFKHLQGVSIWSNTMGIKVFQHSLCQSVSKKLLC